MVAITGTEGHNLRMRCSKLHQVEGHLLRVRDVRDALGLAYTEVEM
jgi:hypothetical protein